MNLSEAPKGLYSWDNLTIDKQHNDSIYIFVSNTDATEIKCTSVKGMAIDIDVKPLTKDEFVGRLNVVNLNKVNSSSLLNAAMIKHNLENM